MNVVPKREYIVQKMDRQMKIHLVLKLGSIGVIATYSVALCYRAGLLAAILPQSMYSRLETSVEKAKGFTHPIKSPQYNNAVKHLTCTYLHVAGGFLASAAGSLAFSMYPHFPIGIPIAATLVPAAAVLAVPKEFFQSHIGRVSLYYISCFSCGWSFGPISWIARDTMIPFATAVCSTVGGFIVPLLLTRGVASYFVSSQVLSCALAVCSSILLFENSAIDKKKSSTAAVNVSFVVCAQLVTNFSLCILHAAPTIYRFINTTYIVHEEDALFQAMVIFGAVAYFVWHMFRKLCIKVCRVILKEDRGDLSRAQQGQLRKLESLSRRTDTVGSIMASLVFAYLYLRVVSYVQRQEKADVLLERSRIIVSRISSAMFSVVA